MPIRVKSCECEDWPCCECADDYAYTAEEAYEMYYCDDCGTSHASLNCPIDDYDEEEDEDDEG